MPAVAAPPAPSHPFEPLDEALPDLLFETDTAGRLVYANAAARAAFDEPEGQPLVALVQSGHRRTAAAFFAALVTGGGEATTELPVMTRGAGAVQVRLHAWALRDDRGAVRGVQAVARGASARPDRGDEAAERLRLLYTVTAPSAEPVAARLQRALALTTSLLGLRLGVLARVEGEEYTVVGVHDLDGGLLPGERFELRETYCALTMEAGDVFSIGHMAQSPYRSRPCYARFGLEAYIGAPVTVGGAPFGILCFSSPQPHPFTPADRDLIRLLAAWVGGVLEEQAQAEAMRAQDALTRAFFDAAPLMMGVVDVLTDVHGTPVDVVRRSDNAASAAFLGATPDQLRGRSVFKGGFTRDLLETWTTSYFAAAKAGRPFRFEHGFDLPGGRRRLVVTVSLVSPPDPTTGMPARLCYVAEDVTDRRVAEQRLQAIFDTTSQSMGLMAPDGTLLQTNRASLAATGCTYSEVVGQKFWDAPWVPDELRDRFRSAIETAATGTPVQFEVSPPDGSGVVYDFSVTPVCDDTGHVVLLVPEGRDLTALRAGERAVRESEQRLRVLSEATFEGLVFSRDGVIIDANEQAAHLLGVAGAAGLVGRHSTEFASAADTGQVAGRTTENVPGVYEVMAVRADGTPFDAELQGRSMPYYDGGDVRVTALRDVSRRKAAERQLRFQADVLAQVTDAVIALTLDGHVTYWNGGAERLHGIPAAEALGRKLSDVVAYTVPGPADDVRRVEAPSPHARPLVEAGDLFLDGQDGRRVVATSSSVLYDERGDEAGLLAVVRDVTAQREAEGNLQYRATHDSLTGLANRVQFREKIADALAPCRQRAGTGACDVAVLFVDLDGFKDVNDSLGHEAGDRLLIELAARMGREIRGSAEGRPADVLARLGGDEFGVLLHGVDESAACGVADRLLAAVAAPLVLDGHRISPGASVGLVAAQPAHVGAPDPVGAVLRDADTAMYAAKQTGRGRVVPFTAAMHAAADERFRLGEDLRGAAARGELRVRYQPIVELTTGRLTGLEALVRWAHPEHGLLTPDRFIPLAESSGLLPEIDRWVLAESCREVGSWGPDAYHLRLGVNCSEATYLDPAFPAYVADMLRTHGVAPERLLLELTERALVEDPALTLQALEALHAHDVRIGIDDFGTGTSSLALLHTLPIDVLKVDRSFVTAMEASPRSHAVVRTIVGLAQDLDMDVVAEGIETAAQSAALWRLGCPHGQGYLYARPLEAADARALLDAPAWPSAAGSPSDWD